MSHWSTCYTRIHNYDVTQVPLMDLAGRRLLLIIPMIVMIVDLIGMTISLILQVSELRHVHTSIRIGNGKVKVNFTVLN